MLEKVPAAGALLGGRLEALVGEVAEIRRVSICGKEAWEFTVDDGIDCEPEAAAVHDLLAAAPKECQYAPEAPNVARERIPVATDPLGTHVGQRPDERECLGILP
jgi:hypothetical protein